MALQLRSFKFTVDDDAHDARWQVKPAARRAGEILAARRLLMGKAW